jgi:hypothetical protein
MHSFANELFQSLSRSNIANNYTIEYNPEDNRPKVFVKYQGTDEFTQQTKKLGISLLVRPRYYFSSEEALVIEAMLLAPNQEGIWYVPFYPFKYGYEFDSTPLFDTIQEVIDHLCDLAIKIAIPVTRLQFGDFEPDEL